MAPWIDIISLTISALTGASAALQQIIQKHPGLSDRAQELYADALKKWSPNKEVRKHWASELPTATALTTYLSTSKSIDSEINSLLKVWYDKLLGDDICGTFLREVKQTEILTISHNDIFAAIKAPYNTIYDASSALRSYYSDIIPGYHINRLETDMLYDWLSQPMNPEEGKEKRVSFLLAGAGLGKTVILHDLQIKLEDEGVPVLGIKADNIFDSSDGTIDKALNLGAPASTVIRQIALDQEVVILIDQIDALSAVLSADRRPLASINSFIDEIIRIPKVRVIISCRQYDFDYENAFVRYKDCNKVNVQELAVENVIDALRTARIEDSQISDTVKSFLRSPLNLFLYCRLSDHTSVDASPTLQELYGSLWKDIIIDKAGNDSGAVVKCLDEIVTEMSRRQVLTINEGILPSESARQRGFLISNSFLSKVASGNIQFIHQTFFEYISSRLFVERGRTLNDLFLDKHQGLFLRPQLKQILDYQRSVDPQTYIVNVREILWGKDNQGKDKYRFQLKQLVITSLAYYPIFLESEKSVARQLLNDPELSPVLLSAISTIDGIELLWEYICDNGGIQKVDESYLRSYLNAVCMIGTSDITKATEYLVKISAIAEDSVLRKHFIWAIDSLPVREETSQMLWDLIKKYGTGDGDIEISDLLNRLIKYDSGAVGNYLFSLLKDYVKENKDKWTLDVPMNYQTIVKLLQKESPDTFLTIGLQMLDVVLASSEEFKDDDIRSAAVLYMYNRRSHALHFDDWLLGKLIDTIEAKVEEKDQKIDRFLDELASSNIAAKQIIALAGWRRDTVRYKDKIYQYLSFNLGKKFHASYLEYQQKKLFESVIILLNEEEQEDLVKKVNKVEPDWEKVHLKGEGRIPVLKIGFTKAQYWSLVPEDILKKYPEEYKEYKTLRRKYKDIKVQEPNRVKTKIGWTATPESKIAKMSKKDLVKHAQTYDKDSYFDWDRPTRHGNAQEYSIRASREPDFMCDVYSTMLDEDTNLNYFVAMGIDGLRKGHCEDAKIDALLEKLIRQLPDNVNDIDANISIRIIRDTDSYIRPGKVPPRFLFDLLVKVALTAKDEESKEKIHIDINDGINQLRGCAVEYLVQLYYCKDYAAQIFDVLKIVAQTGSVATRCALLFEMALLLNVDRKKTLDLFLTAVGRDYNSNLLRMQLHDLNPLKYLAKTDFEALRDYFEECIKHPESHETNIVILFDSWLQNASGAEELTYRMADSSLEGKCYLIRYICNIYNRNADIHDKCLAVLLRYLKEDEKELGRAYDQVAGTFDRWNRAEVQKYLTAYLASPVSCYASHNITNFLKKESRSHPEDCLKWVGALYKNMKRQKDRYELAEYTQILIEAYNSICKYDNQNPALEDAMDMFDELLRINVDNCFLGQYLKEVS